MRSPRGFFRSWRTWLAAILALPMLAACAGCGSGDVGIGLLGTARSAMEVFPLASIVDQEPVVSCAEGSLCGSDDHPFEDCEGDQDLHGVRCEFDYRIFEGAKAYAAAFSFVNPPTADEKEYELRLAAGEFAYAIAYALTALRVDSTAMEMAYIGKLDLDDSPENQCDYLAAVAAAGSALPQITQHIHEYYYARVLRALEAYEEVIDAFITLHAARGDTTGTLYPDFATQRRKEFEERSLAVQALLGPGAALPACTIDPELPPVALALGRLADTGGNVDAAKLDTETSEVDQSLAPWVDLAARQLQEQSVVDGVITRTLARAGDGTSVRPMALPPIPLPWQYYRGLSSRRIERWMTSNGPVDMPATILEGAYQYEPGAVSPTFPQDASAVIASIKAAAALSKHGLPFDEVPVGDPYGQDAKVELVGAVAYLEALAGELFSWPAEPPVVARYDHPSARDCPGLDFDPGAMRGTYESPARAAIAREIEILIGKPIGRWRADLAVGRLEYQDLTGDTTAASYLVVGRPALKRLANPTCGDGTQRCRAADLDDPSEVRAFEAKYVQPNGEADASWSSLAIPHYFGDSHPVRQACSANPTLCAADPSMPAAGVPTWYVQGQFADDIFLLRDRIPLGIDASGGELTEDRPITLYLYREDSTCPAGQQCVDLTRPNETSEAKFGWIADWVSPADVSYEPSRLVTRFDGGRYRQMLETIMAREPGRCVATRYNSLGLEKRLVPALENELIEDGTATESSFQYYLERATQAAGNAAAAVKTAYESEESLEDSLENFETESQLLQEEAGEAVEKVCGRGFAGEGCRSERVSTTLGEIGLLLDPAGMLNLTTIEGVDCSQVSVPSFDELQTALDYTVSLDALKNLANCVARDVVTSLRAARIDDLPIQLQDGVLSYDEQALYGGEYLQTLLAMENQLLELGSNALSIATTLQAIGQRFEGAKAQVSSIITSDAGRTANEMVVVGEAVQAVGSALSGAGSGAGIVGAMLGSAGAATAAQGRWKQLEEQYRKEAESAEAVVREFVSGLLQTAGELQMKQNSMQAAANQVQSLITGLDALELEQEQAQNRADRALERVRTQYGLSDAHVWMNATRSNREARKAVRTSQKLSFVARRAIEFRLVSDLDRETMGNSIMDPPSRWGNDVLFLEDAVSVDAATADATAEVFQTATVDYVTRLRDFAGFYSFLYPFQSSLDTAVLSLKDDFEKVHFSCNELGEAVDDYGASGGSTLPCLCVVDEYTGELAPAATAQCVDANRIPPYDYDGVLLRQKFRAKCVNGGLEPYKPDVCNGDVEYYQVELAVPLLAVEGGTLSSQGQIAAGRYNYRWDAVAVNLVGANVKDCTLDLASSTTCYQSAFVPYSLEHGGKVTLPDHGGELRTFTMSTARVQHGKALAAERVLTAPLAQSDASLIEQYVSPELRGRPLQGTYVLRIYDIPSLVFEQIQDVQLLVRYRSWTAFDPVH